MKNRKRPLIDACLAARAGYAYILCDTNQERRPMCKEHKRQMEESKSIRAAGGTNEN